MKESNVNKLVEQIINIKGLKCNSCIQKIESNLSELQGIKNVKVSLIENKIFIEYNPKKISLKEIKLEINKLGYCTCLEKKCTCKISNTLLEGIAYGLIPHIGCIAFIIGSVLGVTILMEFFRPILMNRYFFHILILVSFVFATISCIIYLKKNGLFSMKGVKRKWKYIGTMYGSTIGINLILIMLVFPMLANVSINPTITGAMLAVDKRNIALVRISVDIPCPGHAPLITSEVQKIDGILKTEYFFPNNFEVQYDATKTTLEEILNLEVFLEYPATIIKTQNAGATIELQEENNTQNKIESCLGGCGGTQSCGGGCGSPTCSLNNN